MAGLRGRLGRIVVLAAAAGGCQAGSPSSAAVRTARRDLEV
jgi:hypothetical protein